MNSIRNISYSLIGQLISNLLSFINRTVFIQTIGISFLGMNGLFASVFGLLSLADLGIGSAIAFSLYEPIARNNKEKINQLMQLYARAYKIIAAGIGVLGILLIPFLPYIIKNMPDIPFIRIYYLLMLCSTVASYLFSYKRTLVLCDQKSYVNSKNTYQFAVLQTTLQILLLVVTKRYSLYLIAATICTILSNCSISARVNKLYPYIKEKPVGKLDEATRRSIKKNVIAMMFHKISAIVVYSSDNVVISTYLGLKMVGIYSNYYMIMQLVTNVLGHIFTGITASVANLHVTGSVEDKRKAFDTIYFLNFWMVSFCTVCFYFLLDPFITLWIGSEYLLDRMTTVVLAVWFYHQSMRFTVGVFKNTAGLYWNDRYKPVFEAGINLIASILLLKYFGIAGVFLGTIFSLMTTSFWVEPYIVYKNVLKVRFKKFLFTYCIYMLVCCMQVTLIRLITLRMRADNVKSFLLLLALCIIIPNGVVLMLFRKTWVFYNALLYAKPITAELLRIKNKLGLCNKITAGNKMELSKNSDAGERSEEKAMVGIVLVTYNRLKLLKKSLECINRQTYKNYAVFIIDNASTDGTREYVKAFTQNNKRFLYYRMKKNIGGAGGFHHGIRLAYQAGADFIWGMDDDAFVKEDALEVLVHTINGMNKRTCLESCPVNNLRKYHPDPEDKKKLVPKKNFLFLGFFIPRNLVEDIGLPRKDLFIYFDDMDYSIRARKAGYQIYQVKASLLQHPDMMQVTKRFNLFGKTFTVQEMPGWKWYYYMRNGILVYPKEDKENEGFRRSHLKKLVGVLFAYPDCFIAALSGYLDGKRKHAGKSKRYPKQ